MDEIELCGIEEPSGDVLLALGFTTLKGELFQAASGAAQSACDLASSKKLPSRDLWGKTFEDRLLADTLWSIGLPWKENLYHVVEHEGVRAIGAGCNVKIRQRAARLALGLLVAYVDEEAKKRIGKCVPPQVYAAVAEALRRPHPRLSQPCRELVPDSVAGSSRKKKKKAKEPVSDRSSAEEVRNFRGGGPWESRRCGRSRSRSPRRKGHTADYSREIQPSARPSNAIPPPPCLDEEPTHYPPRRPPPQAAPRLSSWGRSGPEALGPRPPSYPPPASCLKPTEEKRDAWKKEFQGWVEGKRRREALALEEQEEVEDDPSDEWRDEGVILVDEEEEEEEMEYSASSAPSWSRPARPYEGRSNRVPAFLPKPAPSARKNLQGISRLPLSTKDRKALFNLTDKNPLFYRKVVRQPGEGPMPLSTRELLSAFGVFPGAPTARMALLENVVHYLTRDMHAVVKKWIQAMKLEMKCINQWHCLDPKTDAELSKIFGTISDVLGARWDVRRRLFILDEHVSEGWQLWLEAAEEE